MRTIEGTARSVGPRRRGVGRHGRHGQAIERRRRQVESRAALSRSTRRSSSAGRSWRPRSSTRPSSSPVRLGVDPRQADQNVRGTVVLPHGTGQDRCASLVFAKGDKEREARGGRRRLRRRRRSRRRRSRTRAGSSSTAPIATPDMMGLVGRLGKILGPRGLMPNPKLGTVTFDVAKAVQRAEGGQDRVPRRQGRHRARAVRQGVVRSREALGQRQPRWSRRWCARSRRPPRATTFAACRCATTMGPGVMVDPPTPPARRRPRPERGVPGESRTDRGDRDHARPKLLRAPAWPSSPSIAD